MSDDADLSLWLQNNNLKQGERILILLSRRPDGLTIAEMKQTFNSYGRGSSGWNFSAIVDRLANESRVVLISRRWQIAETGIEIVRGLGAMRPRAVVAALTGLRDFLSRSTDPILTEFIAEAIGCLEHGFHRSAAVLAWSGAVWILQQNVLHHHLAEFNAAGSTRFPDFKKVKNEESFGRIQERDFLQLLDDIHVVSKSLKSLLVQRLDLRNICGHPNTIKISESSAASHVEILIENVYLRFPLK